MNRLHCTHAGLAARELVNLDLHGWASRPVTGTDHAGRSPPHKDERQHGANELASKDHMTTDEPDYPAGARAAQANGKHFATLRARLALRA